MSLDVCYAFGLWNKAIKKDKRWIGWSIFAQLASVNCGAYLLGHVQCKDVYMGA